MNSIISIKNLSKTYRNGYQALKAVNLDIPRGKILALLGPNGAGKTTLISIICGIVSPSSGSVSVDGCDILQDYRQTRSMIGLVPQELTLGMFDKVINSVRFSRGLFGKPSNQDYLETLLDQLSLLDKKDNEIRTLSGGMKRRVLIAKALSHEPDVLFLDEPTAGVDVELRKEMWAVIDTLRQSGVTIILTTHYIEEAEAIADQIGIMSQGQLLLVDDKHALMQKLGKKQLALQLRQRIDALPASLADYPLSLSDDGMTLTYVYDSKHEATGITRLLQAIKAAGITLTDLNTTQSSLEDIFVDLVNNQ